MQKYFNYTPNKIYKRKGHENYTIQWNWNGTNNITLHRKLLINKDEFINKVFNIVLWNLFFTLFFLNGSGLTSAFVSTWNSPPLFGKHITCSSKCFFVFVYYTMDIPFFIKLMYKIWLLCHGSIRFRTWFTRWFHMSPGLCVF